MYTSFHIQNFRLFEELKINDLARVNLIGGKNNVGKTSLLEALFVHSGLYRTEIALRLNTFRGLPPRFQLVRLQSSITPWHPIFRNLDTNQTILLETENMAGKSQQIQLTEVTDLDELKKVGGEYLSAANDKSNGAVISTNQLAIRVLRLTYSDGQERVTVHSVLDYQDIHHPIVPPLPAQSIFFATKVRNLPEDETRRYTELIRRGKKSLLLEALRLMDDRISDVQLLDYGGESLLHADMGTGNTPMPLSFMGEGVVRLASLVIGMAEANGGMIFIDEIENGFHYSILPQIWKAMDRASREFNTQVFATTHSLECIRAAHQAFAESEAYDFRYHRIDRTKSGGNRAVTYDQETMQAAVETDFEVR